EVRACQNKLQRRFDSVVETSVLGAAAAVEVHQGVQRGGGQGFATGEASQRGQDLCRAGQFIFRSGRLADEYLATGGRLSRGGCVEWAFNGQPVDGWIPHDVE